MPFAIQLLDTQSPPTWDGTNDFPSHTDAGTALRPTTGDDKVNYWNQQRTEGDLHKRDLVNGGNVQKVRDYLATRTGLLHAVPAVRVLASSFVVIARVAPASPLTGIYVVGGELANLTDAATDSFELEIYNVTDSVSTWTKATLGVSWTAADPAVDRGPVLAVGKVYELRLKNVSASRKTASGGIVLQPKTLT